jgi:cell division septation protein DedD
MREKYRVPKTFVFSLDLRQITGVVTGCLVVLALSFAVGVGFGRRLASASVTAAPVPVSLDRLDTAKGALPNGVTSAESVFTYQQELTKKDPPPMPVKPAPVVALPHPPPTPAVIAPVEPAHAAAPLQPIAAMAPATPTKVETAVAPAVPAPKLDKQDRWTVQFGAPPRKADADRLVAKLSGLGYSPFVAETDVPGKGHVYRVRIGRFPTHEEAEQFRVTTREQTRLDGFVMAAPAP